MNKNPSDLALDANRNTSEGTSVDMGLMIDDFWIPHVKESMHFPMPSQSQATVKYNSICAFVCGFSLPSGFVIKQMTEI